MDEVESISSILGESAFTKGEPAKAESAAPVVEAAPPAAEVKAEQPVETKSELARDDAGRFAAKAPAEDKPPLTKADVAAIMDERRKRQDLERRLATYEQHQPKAKTDIFDNPDVAISERLQERLGPLENTILSLQVELAKTKMPDFDDAALAFFQVAQNDPVLRHQADTAPDQFQFIYREGKRLMELGDVGGDIMKYREKVTAAERAEVTKRDEQIKMLTAQVEALTKSQAELAAVPRSLNTMSGATPKATDADPDDINQIVRFKAG